MRLLRGLLVVVDLISLANLLTGPGPIVEQLRMLAVAFAFLVAVVALFVVVVFAVALLGRRQPPYPV